MKIQKHLYVLAILLMAAITAGLVPAIASAAETGSQLILSITANRSTAYGGDNITFTYVLTNTDNSTVDNLTLTDSKLGVIPLGLTSLAAGENLTATAVYMVKAADYPGPLTRNVSVVGTSAAGAGISASASVSIELKAIKVDDGDKDDDGGGRTKAEWLRAKGVHGKGIDHAPGLQKPFNGSWKGGHNSASENNTDKRNNGRGNGKNRED